MVGLLWQPQQVAEKSQQPEGKRQKAEGTDLV
jgi:hypothetical protein